MPGKIRRDGRLESLEFQFHIITGLHLLGIRLFPGIGQVGHYLGERSLGLGLLDEWFDFLFGMIFCPFGRFLHSYRVLDNTLESLVTDKFNGRVDSLALLFGSSDLEMAVADRLVVLAENLKPFPDGQRVDRARWWDCLLYTSDAADE